MKLYGLHTLDTWLNRLTMYRVVLYVLLVWASVAIVFSATGVLSISPVALLVSLSLLTLVCWGVNAGIAHLFKITVNAESSYITALILFFIITPPTSIRSFFVVLAAGAIAMASKYVFSIQRQHLFNPAAFAVVVLALSVGEYATWWISTTQLVTWVIIGGLLIARKTRRFDLVLACLVGAIITTAFVTPAQNASGLFTAEKVLLLSPLFFFSFVMLTEPQTTPPRRALRIVYGALTGVLFASRIQIGSFYMTPEIALVLANVFSYAISPKSKVLLTLKEKVDLATRTIEFAFQSDEPLAFRPGQYIELTIGHEKIDLRGNRRFFTIASSPTEPLTHFGVRFYPRVSSFKQALTKMAPGQQLLAGQIAGDFTLPADPKRKLAFIAGGIGITPFRSMVQYLLDKNEARDIVLFYSNNLPTDIAYRDLFDRAKSELGLETVYTATDVEHCPADWKGERGMIDEKKIQSFAPDYQERLFYLSGPPVMVDAFFDLLRSMGVKRTSIKRDFFAGY